MSGFERFMMGAAWGAGVVLVVALSPLGLAVAVLALVGVSLEVLGSWLRVPLRAGVRLVNGMVARMQVAASADDVRAARLARQEDTKR